MSSRISHQAAVVGLLVSFAATGCVETTDAPTFVEESLGGLRRFFLTASTVENLHPSTVVPALTRSDRDYLDPASALGANGPLGAWGPLGALGPLGDNSWDHASFISAAADWSSWNSSQLQGPLGEAGPLGPDGPLGSRYWLPALDCPSRGDQFCKHLQGGGVFSMLGPVGPLGSLGPLGPLGPLGAYRTLGYDLDGDGTGRYLNGRTVERTVRVPYQGSTRVYELVELYPEWFAKSMTDNDTSFMIAGAIDWAGDSDSYTFTSKVQQLVSVVAVPENGFSDFNVQLQDGSGNPIAASSSDGVDSLFFGVPVATGHYIDFVQLSVPANTTLKAKVTARALDGGFGYRLIVTGSGGSIDDTDIRGDFQVAF